MTDVLTSKVHGRGKTLTQDQIASYVRDASPEIRAAAYKEMADTVLATMYALVADELFIRSKGLTACGRAGAILDIGTGMGNLAAELSRRSPGRPVVALDISPAIISEALAYGGLPEGVRPLAGDATMLPFRDNSLAVVASYGVVHHVPDKTRLFAEIYRIETQHITVFHKISFAMHTRKFTILHSNDMHGDFLAENAAESGPCLRYLPGSGRIRYYAYGIWGYQVG